MGVLHNLSNIFPSILSQ